MKLKQRHREKGEENEKERDFVDQELCLPPDPVTFHRRVSEVQSEKIKDGPQ